MNVFEKLGPPPTTVPLSKLVEPVTISEWRMECHKWFDRMWKYNANPLAARSEAYDRLSTLLGVEDAHISSFGIEECKRTIAWAKSRVRGGKKH